MQIDIAVLVDLRRHIERNAGEERREIRAYRRKTADRGCLSDFLFDDDSIPADLDFPSDDYSIPANLDFISDDESIPVDVDLLANDDSIPF